MVTRWISISLLVTTSLRLVAGDSVGVEFFEKKIRPIFVSECYSCHHPEHKVKAGLRLDWKGGWQQGGDSGAVIKPGHPSRSLLYQAVRYTDPDLQMPPKKRLTDQQIKDLEDWIAMGAPDPRSSEASSAAEEKLNLEAARQFWAFQAPNPPTRPSVHRSDWPQQELDYHVLAKLEAVGVEPNPDAGAATLLRRIHFDLTGLPPSPKEIRAFATAANGDRQQAIARVVDELLARPSFGERWGRHWLDIARFSESTGGGRTLLMKEAWRYRDYVVNAFNQDKPYDDFIREQVAGDLLPSQTLDERREHLVATAFLLLGPTNYELQDKTVLEMDIVDEQLDTMGKSILGLTIGCARCHDHKFDPISTEDYYGLAGILKGTKSVIHSNVSTWNTRPLPLPPDQEQMADTQAKELTALDQEIKKLKKRIDSKTDNSKSIAPSNLAGIVVDNEDASVTGSWSSSTGVANYVGSDYIYTNGKDGNNRVAYTASIPTAGEYEIRLAYTPHPNRSSQTLVIVHHATDQQEQRINQREKPTKDACFVSLGRFQLAAGDATVVTITDKGANGAVVADAIQLLPIGAAIPDAKVANKKGTEKRVDPALKTKLSQLETTRKTLAKTAIQRIPLIAADEGESPGDIPIAVRGDANNIGPVTPRSFIRVAYNGSLPLIPAEQSGRRQLADWLAGKDNPLTARIFVNRVWQHLFGQGIFANVDNIGHMGRLPSNQPLLDHLATELIDGDWSIKSLIRTIILSHTYQLDTTQQARGVEVDLENHLFWRQNPRRLEAEAIRDSILTASGQLDSAVGGPTIKSGTTIEYGYQFEDTRRSLYTPVFRNTPLELLAVFDFADPNIVVGQRSNSSVATQALYLLNSPFVRQQAQHAARDLLRRDLPTQASQIETAYLLSVGRLPTEAETTLIEESLSQAAEPQAAWAQVFHALFASLEFRYLN